MVFTEALPSSPEIACNDESTCIEEDVALNTRLLKRSARVLDSDDENNSTTEISVTQVDSSSYKKLKLELPEIISKKGNEKPLPHPFPLPANYRPEVELCLKSGKMTTEARKHFLSAIASAIFSFKRYYCKWKFYK